MEEPTVAISLKEYNELRDRAQINGLLLDKITTFEIRMSDMNRKIYELNNVIDQIKR